MADLALQFLVVLLHPLGATADGFVHLCRPVDLVDTDDHLSRPLPHPPDARVHSVGLWHTIRMH